MRHVSLSTHSYGWVMSLIHMEDAETCLTLHSFIWMSHVSHSHGGCWDMTHLCWNEWHDVFIWRMLSHVTFSIHSYRWVMSLIHMQDAETWLIRIEICDMTYSYGGCWVMSHIWMRYVTHMNETCHTFECVISHNMWTRHATHMNESRHTDEWVMSHIWMSHVTYMNESYYTYEWVMSHIWTCHVTHINESCHTYEWVMSHIWMSHVTHSNESCHT